MCIGIRFASRSYLTCRYFSLQKVPSRNPPVARAAIMKASRTADLSSILVTSSGFGALSL